jgi:hypothetical protein
MNTTDPPTEDSESGIWKKASTVQRVAKWCAAVVGGLIALMFVARVAVGVENLFDRADAHEQRDVAHDRRMDTLLAIIRDYQLAAQRDKEAQDFTVKNLLCIYQGYDSPLTCPHFREKMVGLAVLEDSAIVTPGPEIRP